MGIVAMDTAVGEKAVKMQRRIVLFAIVDRSDNRGSRRKASVLRGVGNTGKVLENDPAGADIRMTDLRISHLARGKTDVSAGCSDQCMRETVHQRVDVLCTLYFDRVSAFFGRIPESVKDYQCS